ncbi:MAG TPA: hypothetical protein VFF28_00530 [Candidatus Nanoarchaeia archaeon]|nr:hypothetical protein [Candidatus Nanoarchaeia archaeon]
MDEFNNLKKKRKELDIDDSDIPIHEKYVKEEDIKRMKKKRKD